MEGNKDGRKRHELHAMNQKTVQVLSTDSRLFKQPKHIITKRESASWFTQYFPEYLSAKKQVSIGWTKFVNIQEYFLFP